MTPERPHPGHRPRKRISALTLVLLVALATVVPAVADDSQPGWLTVSITPDVAAPVAVDGVVRNTGSINRLKLPAGEHLVTFGQVDGYLAPSARTIDVQSNDTAHLQVEYEQAGTVEIDVTPDGIEPLITVNDLARDVGPTTVPVPVGDASVCGQPIAGYQSPPCQDVSVAAGETSSVTLAYENVSEDDVVVDGRVSEGLVALYDFSDGSGSTIADTAGVLAGLDLTIANTSATTWGEGTLSFDSATLATTAGAPTALYQQIRDTGEFTVEAWIEADNLTQNGPARILSLGKDSRSANVVLGQGSFQGGSDLIEVRHQRAGDYQLPTEAGTLTTDLTHVAATRTADGTVTVYIDGQPEVSRTMEGDPANWDLNHRLGLGAELSGERPWLGTYHLTAIYNTALTGDQITTNHTAGPNGDTPTPDPEPEPQPEPQPEPEPEPEPEPAPPPAEGGNATHISQHGITWKFDGEYEVGQYANGDFWVLGPVTLVDITPRSELIPSGWVDNSDRVINGSMVNPGPGDGGSLGYGHIRANSYNPSKNVAFGISQNNPLSLQPHSSLVSTISATEPYARPGIHTAAVLTVVDERPAANSFRPPYSGSDKTARFTTDDIRWDLLPELGKVNDSPDVRSLAKEFERVWLDHRGYWSGRKIHPSTSMPNYGRDMASLLGEGSLALMLDVEREEKEELLTNYLQIGIDFYGIVADGGTRIWEPDGGHNQGRKWPILFAGVMLGDAEMAAIGDRTDVFFGEDAQTFYVTQADIDRGNGYTSSHLGMPEWGIRHATDPTRDRERWDTGYRRSSTANSFGGHVLSARIMGLQAAWNHDALFDYQDRYVSIEEPGTFYRFTNPFTENMWERYRGQY